MKETLFENCSVENVTVFYDDIPESVLVKALKHGTVNLDTETTGLDWRTEKMKLCQLYIQGDKSAYVVRVTGKRAPNMETLMNSTEIRKVFHYAMFDLMFMRNTWYIQPRNIECTKIASKITFPDRERHSLKNLLEEFELATLDKTLATSDWGGKLTAEMLEYGVKDTLYLARLFTALLKVSTKGQRINNKNELILEAFKHIPTRVELEYRGHKDVYTY